MHPLDKRTLNIVRQEHLIQQGEKILTGVSAGPDSTALLHVLARLAPVLDITLAAVYVNHGLRPDEAENEKNHVEAAARRLGIDFFYGSVDVKGLAAAQRLSIEHGARLLRYDFFEKIAHRVGAHKIAVAHTADDQAEEVLLRLIKGTARKGLSGMKTIRAGTIIRPFLRQTKRQILDYLDRYSIPFLIDSSNRQNIYLRNRIRNDLLPYLAEFYNPDIRATLCRTANILQDEEELLENIVEKAFTETVTIIPRKPGQHCYGGNQPGRTYPQEIQIDLGLFTMQPRAIQRRLLEKCCWMMACEPRSRQIEQLLQLALPGSSNTGLHLSDGLRIHKGKELLSFTYPKGRGPFRGTISNESGMELPEISIPGPGSYILPVLNKKLLVQEIEKLPPNPEHLYPKGECLDSALFSFPLALRSPRPGDRFHPLGAPGSKKITEFLRDLKIDRQTRRLTPVLCAGASIITIPGLRINHRFRVTENTTRVVLLRWEDMKD